MNETVSYIVKNPKQNDDILNNYPAKEDLSDGLKDLGKEQLDAYYKLENTNNNYFITGKAGTGKSRLLRAFVKNTHKTLAVIAPTGIAAINVKGQMIHSFFWFGYLCAKSIRSRIAIQEFVQQKTRDAEKSRRVKDGCATSEIMKEFKTMNKYAEASKCYKAIVQARKQFDAGYDPGHYQAILVTNAFKLASLDLPDPFAALDNGEEEVKKDEEKKEEVKPEVKDETRGEMKGEVKGEAKAEAKPEKTYAWTKNYKK